MSVRLDAILMFIHRIWDLVMALSPDHIRFWRRTMKACVLLVMHKRGASEVNGLRQAQAAPDG